MQPEHPPQLKQQGISIVFRGDFSPTIFHPAWLSQHGLLRHQEAEAANITIISQQVTIITAEWLQLNVTPDRFQVSTVQEAYYEPLRDLVFGIFSLLPATPVRVLGINCNFYYGLSSRDKWNRIGHRLVPKADWEPVIPNSGLRSLVVESSRPDNWNGYVQVRVEPSDSYENSIFIEVNDHYELRSDSESIRVEDSEALKILMNNWFQAMDQGNRIAEHIGCLGESK